MPQTIKEAITQRYAELTSKLEEIYDGPAPIPKLEEIGGVTNLVITMSHFTSYHDRKDYAGFIRQMAWYRGVSVTDQQVEAAVPHVESFLDFLVPILRKPMP